jgi:hypothetical protein
LKTLTQATETVKMGSNAISRMKPSALLLAGLAIFSSSLASADALRVDGDVIEGVDISGITYRAGELVVELAPGSNTLAPMAVLPDFDVPTGDLCGNSGQAVSCTGGFGLLQDRVLSDSIELNSGVVVASEFVLSEVVNPNLMVLEFRSSETILPEISVSLSLEPGGDAISADCSFTMSGYVGSRIYLAHDGSPASLRSSYCDIDRGERYFLNLALSNGSGVMSTVRRTIKLAGI